MVIRRALLLASVAAALAIAFCVGLGSGRAQRTRTAAGIDTTAAIAQPLLPGWRQSRLSVPDAAKTHRAAEYRALREASAGADIDATYRLARGAQACFELRRERAALDMIPAGERAARQARLGTLETECIGDERTPVTALRDMWRHAAQLGSREAQFHYAVNPLFNFQALTADDFDYLRDWHDHAAGYLEAAAADGDSRAAMVLALASDPGRLQIPSSDEFAETAGEASVLAWLREQNAALAYRYYALDALLDDATNRSRVDAAMARLASGMTQAQILEALQWAQDAQLKMRRGTTPG